MNKSILKKVMQNVLRQEISHRGGGIEISLKAFGFRAEDKMSAYQNYLGGGMLGRIQTNHNIRRTSFTTNEIKKLEAISTTLAWYMHTLTNHSEDEWESATFEQNQNREISAY
jgi:hypothetical protein